MKVFVTEQPEVRSLTVYLQGRLAFISIEQMVPCSERRTNRRYDCDATIKWSFFCGHLFYHGRTLNFSTGGLYFETDVALKPGATILIRIEAYGAAAPRTADHACLRTISLAEVKWCRDLEHNGETFFGAGARYHIGST